MDNRLNASAYGAITVASDFRAWLSGYVNRFNGLDDDLHAEAAILAKSSMNVTRVTGIEAPRGYRRRC